MTGRQGNLLGFAACAGLLAYAYYAQVVLHLEPCPLCIFQRVGVFTIGIVFLIAAAHDPVGWARRVYASLLALAALASIGVAVRHLYIQSLPEGSVAACGASLAGASADGSTKVGYVGASGIEAGASPFPVSEEALAYVVNVPGTTTTLTTTYGGQTGNGLDGVLRPDVVVTVYLKASPPPSE